MSEMKDELDFLVAHRKQTRSSGSHILFQAWHIKGKKGSKGFVSVILSHREFWHKPGNLQTNKTEKLEVKLAGNVLPPYIQTSDNIVELSLLLPPCQMLISFKEMWTQYISIAIKHLTVTEEPNSSYYPYRERTLLLRSLECYNDILTLHQILHGHKGEKRKKSIERLHTEHWGLQKKSIKQP